MYVAAGVEGKYLNIYTFKQALKIVRAPRGRGAPVGRGGRGAASQGDLDNELDSFMKTDGVSYQNE